MSIHVVGPTSAPAVPARHGLGEARAGLAPTGPDLALLDRLR